MAPGGRSPDSQRVQFGPLFACLDVENPLGLRACVTRVGRSTSLDMRPMELYVAGFSSALHLLSLSLPYTSSSFLLVYTGSCNGLTSHSVQEHLECAASNCPTSETKACRIITLILLRHVRHIAIASTTCIGLTLLNLFDPDVPTTPGPHSHAHAPLRTHSSAGRDAST